MAWLSSYNVTNEACKHWTAPTMHVVIVFPIPWQKGELKVKICGPVHQTKTFQQSTALPTKTIKTSVHALVGEQVIKLKCHNWSFEKKDLYLVITQKLIFLKSAGFHVKFGRFHMKFGRFHVKSTCKPYKSNNSRKTLQFYGVQWKGYVSWFTWNLPDFMWNPPNFERPIARNGKAYVF